MITSKIAGQHLSENVLGLQSQNEQQEQEYWLEHCYINSWRQSAELVVKAVKEQCAFLLGKFPHPIIEKAEIEKLIQRHETLGPKLIELYVKALFITDPELMNADKGNYRPEAFKAIIGLWQNWRVVPKQLNDDSYLYCLAESVNNLERGFKKEAEYINNILELETTRKKENKKKKTQAIQLNNEILSIASELLSQGCPAHSLAREVASSGKLKGKGRGRGKTNLPNIGYKQPNTKEKDVSVQHISRVIKQSGISKSHKKKN